MIGSGIGIAIRDPRSGCGMRDAGTGWRRSEDGTDLEPRGATGISPAL